MIIHIRHLLLIINYIMLK